MVDSRCTLVDRTLHQKQQLGRRQICENPRDFWQKNANHWANNRHGVWSVDSVNRRQRVEGTYLTRRRISWSAGFYMVKCSKNNLGCLQFKGSSRWGHGDRLCDQSANSLPDNGRKKKKMPHHSGEMARQELDTAAGTWSEVWILPEIHCQSSNAIHHRKSRWVGRKTGAKAPTRWQSGPFKQR